MVVELIPKKALTTEYFIDIVIPKLIPAIKTPQYRTRQTLRSYRLRYTGRGEEGINSIQP